ncbi:YrrS family protein [Evansella tamaricis]|uniref:YrrS family protein n=1 Tax=Evansella tamaricis TaxID=2069301 RepID=A0ABS6JI61_9BACI|nr:YrrS family protein [Evansella tamaricis]MBU9713350.1 YrrS family protein [Evansella tamaricis]
MSYGSYGPRRSDMQKEKRKNIWLNVGIGIVVVAIVFVSASLIFGGGSSEPASGDDLDRDEQNQADMATEEEQEESAEDTDQEEQVDNEPSDSESENNDENPAQNSTDEDNSSDSTSLEFDGEWQPVGTMQEEPFQLSSEKFSKEHINWEEMTIAFMYATGIDEEDIIVWRVNNGGDMQSVEGWVGAWEHRDNPYKVRLEWVTNEGWVPVSVEEQDENPFR